MNWMQPDPRSLSKVAVLMGGTSAERPVSLMSGPGVLDALCSLGVDAHAFDPAQRALDDLKREGFARAFIALHGRHGEDGTVQGALELLGIPYTGSGVMASALAMDKVMTKRIWESEGLPTPPWRLIRADATREEQMALPDALGLPLIVKPVREGSSFGVSKVAGYSDVAAAVKLAATFDAEVLSETCIVGEEMTCPVLGQGDSAVALPVIRIGAPEGKYDFEHKYVSDATVYEILPDSAETREIQRLTLAAYRLLGCRGWGRADLMVRASDRQPFLLEMNTSPGMTSHSLVPKSAAHIGLAYPQLCLHLLAGATLDSAR